MANIFHNLSQDRICTFEVNKHLKYTTLKWASTQSLCQRHCCTSRIAAIRQYREGKWRNYKVNWPFLNKYCTYIKRKKRCSTVITNTSCTLPDIGLVIEKISSDPHKVYQTCKLRLIQRFQNGQEMKNYLQIWS